MPGAAVRGDQHIPRLEQRAGTFMIRYFAIHKNDRTPHKKTILSGEDGLLYAHIPPPV